MSLHNRWLSETRKSLVGCSVRSISLTHLLSSGPFSFFSRYGASSFISCSEYANGKVLGRLVDEKLKRVDDGQVGDQIDFDVEFIGRLLEDDPGLIVAEGILLPVDEMLFRSDAQRVGLNRRAAVGRGPQPEYVREERHQAVICVVGFVVDCDNYGHRISYLLLRLGLNGSAKEGFGNGCVNSIHFGLQFVGEFMQALLEDLVDVGVREPGHQLPQTPFGVVVIAVGRGVANAVHRMFAP